MVWREKGSNLYPNIILSDCSISQIQIKDNNIILIFTDYGFIKKDVDDRYYRTTGAEIVVEGCYDEEICIKEIRTHQLSEGMFFDSVYDMELEELVKNVNSGKWGLEIVEEFYSTGGTLYICQIRENGGNFWLHIKMTYKNLLYLWNGIKHDWPID